MYYEEITLEHLDELARLYVETFNSEGQMKTEDFSIGDIVFLDDDGMIEQAFDKEDK